MRRTSPFAIALTFSAIVLATGCAPLQAPPSALDPRLNERYLFDNFVVGPSNELGWTAAKQVADGKAARHQPNLR